MRAVVQRVRRAEVRVDGDVVGRIEEGMLVLLGVLEGDDSQRASRLAEKIAGFRFFADADGRMNRAAVDFDRQREGARDVLVVSQFTLAADGRKGRRPSFDRAARPEIAEPLYGAFCDALRAAGLRVETGVFGAMMQVELVNDGPVTFVLDEPPGSGAHHTSA